MSQLFSGSTPKISQIKSLFLLTFIIVIHFMGQEELSVGILLRFKLNNLIRRKLKYWLL